MSNRQRITNLLGGGTLPHHFLPKLREACDELGVSHTLLTMGRLEFNRATASEPTDFGHDGVIDVSPSPKDIVQAVGNAGDDQIAESNRDSWEPLVHAAVERVVQAHLDCKLVDGQTLWVQGILTGHGKPATQTLRELKKRIPRQYITGFSTLSEDAIKQERLREGHDMFVRLKDDGVLETTLLMDNRSPFVLAHKLEVQDRFAAKAVASLVAAQAHVSKNPSLADLSRGLGAYGAYNGMTFCSRSLAPMHQPKWWEFLRRVHGSLPLRGTADIASVILEAKEATKEALTGPNALAIEETIDLQKPLTIIYTVPISLNDPKAWVAFGSEMRRWLLEKYPTATPVFVSGNGTPAPHRVGSYWCQVSALFPLPDVPAPIKRLLSSDSLVRRHAPLPVAGSSSQNGTGPVAEVNETKRGFQAR